jgi:hypothetical protein
MRNFVRRTLGAAMVLGLTACASGAGSSGAASGPRTSREILTTEQIQSTKYNNLYDVIQALRANWMNDRGKDTLRDGGAASSVVLVYLNDTKLGGVAELKAISPLEVSYIQHYDGIAAAGRWGLDHGKGVIYVSTHPLQR